MKSDIVGAIRSFFEAFAAWFGKSKERQEVRREGHQIKAVEYADKVFDGFDIDWVHDLIKEADPDDETWRQWLYYRNLFEHSRGRYKDHRKNI